MPEVSRTDEEAGGPLFDIWQDVSAALMVGARAAGGHEEFNAARQRLLEQLDEITIQLGRGINDEDPSARDLALAAGHYATSAFKSMSKLLPLASLLLEGESEIRINQLAHNHVELAAPWGTLRVLDGVVTPVSGAFALNGAMQGDFAAELSLHFAIAADIAEEQCNADEQEPV